MIKSMTGFAQRELSTPRLSASIVLKSYNNRYLDVYVSMPPYLAALEARIREAISAVAIHGKVELAIRVRELLSPPQVRVDKAAAAAVAAALREASEAAGLHEPVRLGNILAFEGVVSFDRDIDAEELWADLSPALAACLEDFDAERRREGAATRADLERALASIEGSLRLVEAEAGELESKIRSGLERKFKEVLGELADETRVLTEIASYLAKHTINEEIVRLGSHIAAFRATMDEGACGKKLDFICQEMNREVNTIGSKNMLVSVGKAVVSMKDAVENIREQIRNVE